MSVLVGPDVWRKNAVHRGLRTVSIAAVLLLLAASEAGAQVSNQPAAPKVDPKARHLITADPAVSSLESYLARVRSDSMGFKSSTYRHPSARTVHQTIFAPTLSRASQVATLAS